MIDHYKKLRTETAILAERKERLFGDSDFYTTKPLQPIPPPTRYVRDCGGAGFALLPMLAVIMVIVFI